ncbi:MAG: tetratricopeptide repeat protein, partial [Bacteroidia bacterium]|nr:tetratricopeptide repeat protein [Bacteroidia bacterium]
MKRTILLLTIFTIVSTSFAQSAADYYRKAVVKFRSGDYAGAAVEYTRALDVDASSAVLYNNRGVCYYRIERYSDALNDYNQAVLI